MSRRITCFVIFVTIIWGASTKTEEKIRDIFKSNMTRNDFSNLLQSLIKLNERRVSILQKLYRLEDYGVLSEVLRSGDKNMGNENPNNLYLIVMSKNKTEPLLYIGFEGVDSLPSVNGNINKVKTSKKLLNIPSNLDLIKDSTGFIQNIRRVIINGIPNVHGPKEINIIDDESKNNSTPKPVNHLSPHQRVKKKSSHFDLLRALKANIKKQDQENSKFEIVNNNSRPNATEEFLEYENNFPKTVVENGQGKKYLEFNFSFPFYNHENPKTEGKYEADDNNSSSSSKDIHIQNDNNNQYRKINGDIFMTKLLGNDFSEPIRNKENSKKEIIIINNNQNLHKPLENKQDNKYYKMKVELTRKLEEKLNGNVNSAKANEQKPTVDIKNWSNDNLNLNHHETKANNTESKHFERLLKHKNALRSKKRNLNKFPSLSIMLNNETGNGNNTAKITENLLSYLHSNNNYNNATENSRKDKPITAKPHTDPNPDGELIIGKDRNAEKISASSQISVDQFGFVNNGPKNAGRSKHTENDKQPMSNENSFEAPADSKPILRNTYKGHVKKKAEKFCSKSCISAYKNVCRKLKCSSGAKRALRRECKRSCWRTFTTSDSSSCSSEESDRHYWFNPHLH